MPLLVALELSNCGSSNGDGPSSSAGQAGSAGASAGASGAGQGGANEAGKNGGGEAGQGGAGGAKSELDGRFDFELELDARAESCLLDQPEEERRWLLVGAVEFEAGTASGFLALNGLGQPDGSTAFYTLGSADFTGTSAGRRTHWDTEILYEEDGVPEDAIAVALDLAFAEDGGISGEAEGIWLQADADFRCERPFTATVTGGPDRRAPAAVASQQGARLLLPFDPITGYFTEPVSPRGISLAVEAAGAAVPAKLVLVDDAYGRPRAFEIVADGAWPAGSTLSASLRSLRDGAGNHADAELGPFAVPSQPDSASNPGFENELSGWLADPANESGGPVFVTSSMYFQDDLGMPFSVPAPEGSRMVFIEAVGARLIGHFAPVKPARAVTIMLGVSDPTIAEVRDYPAGFRISVISNGTQSVIGDGSDLPKVLPDARGNFAGFTELSFALPAAISRDFWLVIEPWGYAPPVHLPALLVDDVRLR